LVNPATDYVDKANNDRAKAWIAQQKQLQAAENRHQPIIDRHQQAYNRTDAKVRVIATRYGTGEIGPVAHGATSLIDWVTGG
jgi:hypothetical protein